MTAGSCKCDDYRTMLPEEILTKGETQFYRLRNGDGKVWLFPKRGLRPGMELYQPSGRRGIMLKRLFPLLHRWSIVRRVAGAETLTGSLDEEILSVARMAFGPGLTNVSGLGLAGSTGARPGNGHGNDSGSGAGEIYYSIFGGTPSVHRKITIQFFNRERILGYGKVTEIREIADLFEHERSLLADLHTAGIDNIPECLYNSQLPSGRYLFLQSTVKTRDSFSPGEWSDPHEDFLKDMAERTATEIQFEDSDYYRQIKILEKYLPIIPEATRDAVAKAIGITLREMCGRRARYSAYHADFTPWNMLMEQGRLYVFDWEYGARTYPPMLDKYHFFIQQMIHVEHLTAEEILTRLRETDWADSQGIRLYLLDIISRFVAREKGEISPELRSMLRIWGELLCYNM